MYYSSAFLHRDLQRTKFLPFHTVHPFHTVYPFAYCLKHTRAKCSRLGRIESVHDRLVDLSWYIRARDATTPRVESALNDHGNRQADSFLDYTELRIGLLLDPF